MKFKFAFPLLTVLATQTYGQYVDTLRNATDFLKSLNVDHYNNYQSMFSSFLGATVDIQSLGQKGLKFGLTRLDTKLNVSALCLGHIEVFLEALVSRQQWALRMLDATGKPPSGLLEGNTKWLGSYDECSSVVASVNTAGKVTSPFTGHYCLASFPLGNQESLNAIGQSSASLMIGTCFPDSCTSEDATSLISSLLNMVPVNLTSIPSGHVACKPKKLGFDTKAIAVVVVCIAFGLLMSIATLYDVLAEYWLLPRSESGPQNDNCHDRVNMTKQQDLVNGVISENRQPVQALSYTKQSSHIQSNGDVTNVCMSQPETKTTSQQDKRVQVLLSFSVYTNAKKILNTSQPPGALSAVNGIRFLSMTWVILGHGVGFSMSVANNMAVFAPKMFKRLTFQAVANATVSVDTFFTLSGLLVAYLSLKEMKKRGGIRKFNWGMFYFHRFWRLTPPYMLFLMFYVCLMKYFSTGPLWTEEGLDEDACKDTWWKNLLYVNNLVESRKECMSWGWYLANDMQFFVVSPLMLILLYYSPLLGTLSCVGMVIVNFISVGVIASKNDMNANLVLANAGRGGTADLIYAKPWCRIGPYAVGFFTGYILFRTECKLTLPKIINLIGWIIATAVGLLVVYGLYDSEGNLPNFSRSINALYLATHRTAWGAAVCWVILACATGYGGLINTILSWKAFIPLARLTYCAYLVHLVVMYVYFMSKKSVVYLSDIEEIYMHIGNVVVSYAVAFIVSLAFEAPMMGLEKALLGRRKNS